jgi:hypothetical protein
MYHGLRGKNTVKPALVTTSIMQYLVLDDIKGVIRKSTDNAMTKLKRINGQTTVYKALHRKLKIKHHVPHKKSG